jgi:DNA-binding NarL/FixJ family response regulator
MAAPGEKRDCSNRQPKKLTAGVRYQKMIEKEIRILIADDHPMFRFGLRALLQTEEGLQVIGEAGTGLEAVELATALQPDVVLMDINIPQLNGIEATRQIVAHCPDCAVLMVSMLDDDTVLAAMRAGARGYLVKGAEGEETVRAIRAVAGGQTIFSPGLGPHVLQLLSGAQRPLLPFSDLTPREHDILELVAQGLTNQAIAEKLFIGAKTVRNQVSTIYSKLQVSGRAEAIIKARDAGMGRGNEGVNSSPL